MLAGVRCRQTAMITLALVATLSVSAEAQQVTVRCERLDRAARDELRARMRLMLRSAEKSAPVAVGVECQEDLAELIWQGAFVERIRIDETDGLIEGTLDALETRLAESLPDPEPPKPDPVPRFAPRRRPGPPQRGGGVGFGLALEPSPLTAGGRLDLGLPLGPLAVVLVQSVRRAPADTLLVGGDLGIAWGAPYFPHWPFGVFGTFGIEALSVSSTAGGPGGSRGDRWDYATVAAIGVRGALALDRTVFWAGIDGRRRFAPLGAEIRGVELARTSLLVSLGVLFSLDLNDRKRPSR